MVPGAVLFTLRKSRGVEYQHAIHYRDLSETGCGFDLFGGTYSVSCATDSPFLHMIYVSPLYLGETAGEMGLCFVSIRFQYILMIPDGASRITILLITREHYLSDDVWDRDQTGRGQAHVFGVRAGYGQLGDPAASEGVFNSLAADIDDSLHLVSRREGGLFFDPRLHSLPDHGVGKIRAPSE